MRELKEYNRNLAVEYARMWALYRNPKYKDYDPWGGDCTNYISQCIHAGGIPFDHEGKDELQKWYWYSDSSRTPSWTAADPFGRYILNNNNENTQNKGIYAVIAEYNELELGDIIQLIYQGKAYHTMIVTEVILDDRNYLIDYLICQHTEDLLDFPLSEKIGERKYIKILGYY
ncbi:MAG: amidase domain-containing protein [Paraclostridium sordellii]|uniref:amidase domain-containing protein n=1 Tax=Paraclostridium sordellii TaxID=1505 RepID=UPI0022DEC7D9|nr:amidase domain-containing protein [Paeniclostridium sordellii]